MVTLRSPPPVGSLLRAQRPVEDGFLRAVWRARISPDFAEPGQVTATWAPWLDTLHIYRQVYPQLENHKLQALIEIFDLQAA